MPPFIDYSQRTTSARSARIASPPDDAEDDSVGPTAPGTAHGADGAPQPHEVAAAANRSVQASGHGNLQGARGGDFARTPTTSGSQEIATRGAARLLGAGDTAVPVPAPTKARPSHLSVLFRRPTSAPTGTGAPLSPRKTASHDADAAPAPFPSPPTSPPTGPRKLRRKSHGAAAAVGPGTHSPPASPLISYVQASGHPGSIPCRDPTGQVVAALLPSPSEPPSRPGRQDSPPGATATDDKRAIGAAGTVLCAPGFGSIVREVREPGLGAGADDTSATDRHYIARMLANLQLQYEFSALSQIGTLAGYGPPFLPHANGPNSRPPPPGARDDAANKRAGPGGSLTLFGLLSGSSRAPAAPRRDPQFAGYAWTPGAVAPSPLCAYLFARFVHAMPGLRGAKQEYWTDHVQPFFDSFAERDLSATIERGEITKRRMLAFGIVRLLGTYTSRALSAPRPRRALAPAPSRPTAGAMRLVDVLVGGAGGMDELARAVLGLGAAGGAVDGAYNAWVGVLDAGLGPAEADSGEAAGFHVLTQPLATPSHPLVHALRPLSAFVALDGTLRTLDPASRLALPALPVTQSALDARDAQTWLRWLVVALSCPAATVRPDSSERDADVLASARAALETFLLSTPSGEGEGKAAELRRAVEIADARAQPLADEWARVGRRTRMLRTTWVRYRGALIRGDELDETIKHVRRCPTLQELPQEYRDAEEWAMIYVAQALHYIFVGAATGPEVLNILRSFHELIPYGAIKLGLNLVNPTLAIRAIVQLVLGQPIGQLSLFQRIWSHVCNNANKHQRTLITQFRAKLAAHAGLCDALQAHVAEGYVKRQATKAAALNRGEDIVLTIVRERCTPDECELVERWHAAFVDAAEDAAASAAAASFADLKELLAAYYRFRDREQVLAIALEPNTPRLLHASIAVFYSTIHAVANASRLSDRVGDLQAFLDDLVEIAGRAAEPAEFIRLAQRHHQALYYFVHELAANGGDLLDPILAWAADGLAFLREGPPETHSSATAAGAGATADVNIDALLAGADAETRAGVLREARAFARWTALRKVQHDIELRVDLLLATRSAAGASNHDDRAQLSKPALWARYLAWLPLSPALRDSFADAATRQRAEAHRAGPGGDLEWAVWWAARETAGAAGREGIVVAQREAARAALAPAPAGDRARMLRRESSGMSAAGQRGKKDKKALSPSSAMQEGAHGPPHARIEQELAIPSPSSDATRALLGGYVAELKKALSLGDGKSGRK